MASTTVHYDADAVVGGMIGGVGQRMIAGAARRTAGEFFDAVATDVLHGPTVGGPAAAALAGGELAGVGQVFAGGTQAAGGGAPTGRRTDLLIAFGLGALVALVGVVLGRRTARSGRDASPS